MAELAQAVMFVAAQAGDGATAGAGGAAVMGDVGGDVIVGLTEGFVIRLMDNLESPDPAVRVEALELLRAWVPESAAIQAEAVAVVPAVLGKAEVPPKDLVAHVEALAQRQVEMLEA